MKEIEVVKLLESRIDELKGRISRMKAYNKFQNSSMLREMIYFTEKTLAVSQRLLESFNLGTVHV